MKNDTRANLENIIMKILNFTASIAAPRSRVWFVLWNDYSYRQWASTFYEGSYAVSDWQQSSRIHFLAPDGRGMYAEIVEKSEPGRMVFRHLGELKNFAEQPPGGQWQDALESYTLEETDTGTLLHVTVNTAEDFVEAFNQMFPKALALVKQLAENFRITVSALVTSPIAKVWEYWNAPHHIMQWNQASADWHTPRSENDLREGGRFLQRMESKDGSMGFDFVGTYTTVQPYSLIEYQMEDGRQVRITFEQNESGTLVTESFEPEGINILDLQYAGWLAILHSFKSHTES